MTKKKLLKVVDLEFCAANIGFFFYLLSYDSESRKIYTILDKSRKMEFR